MGPRPVMNGKAVRRVNVEVKARCEEPERIRNILNSWGADFRGVDRQVDTYFQVPQGRLKMREGNIETALIFYDRPDQVARWTDEIAADGASELVECRNLSSALKALKASEFDLYIIDVLLPSGRVPAEFRAYLAEANLTEPTELGGLLVVKYLLAQKENAKIVVLSNLTNEGDKIASASDRVLSFWKGDKVVTVELIRKLCVEFM